jgi:hypothetical protein
MSRKKQLSAARLSKKIKNTPEESPEESSDEVYIIDDDESIDNDDTRDLMTPEPISISESLVWTEEAELESKPKARRLGDGKSRPSISAKFGPKKHRDTLQTITSFYNVKPQTMRNNTEAIPSQPRSIKKWSIKQMKETVSKFSSYGDSIFN